MTRSLSKITGGLSFEEFSEIIYEFSCATHSAHGDSCNWTEEAKVSLRKTYDAIKETQGSVTRSYTMLTGRALQAQSTEFEW